jgi:signal transduction histidine kinase
MAEASRKPRLLRSVRARVTAAAVIGVLAVLVVAAVLLVATQRRFLTEELEETLVEAADTHARQAEAEGAEDLPSPSDDDGVAQIVDGDGIVVASTPNLAGRPPIADPPPEGEASVTRTIDGIPFDAGPYLVLSRRAGTNVIHVGATRADIDESSRILATSFAVAIPAVTLVLAVLVWWLVGRTLRPVEAIRAEVDAIEGSDLHRRVPQPEGDDEIARLARTMNSMLGRVEAASARQRRFVGDASHELRTPLTRMRAELEVDLAHPAEADLTATHRSALDEVIGLQRLVDDLLALARSDAGVVATSNTGVDLSALARRQADRVTRPGLAVDVRAGAVVVPGDADDLARAVGNVVDNAARYARAGIWIEVALRDGHGVLAVADDGPGIPEADRERVFERFTRLDDGRARDAGGLGLGLSMVKTIVERHGGTVEVADAPIGGARFAVRLPAA